MHLVCNATIVLFPISNQCSMCLTHRSNKRLKRQVLCPCICLTKAEYPAHLTTIFLTRMDLRQSKLKEWDVISQKHQESLSLTKCQPDGQRSQVHKITHQKVTGTKSPVVKKCKFFIFFLFISFRLAEKNGYMAHLTNLAAQSPGVS